MQIATKSISVRKIWLAVASAATLFIGLFSLIHLKELNVVPSHWSDKWLHFIAYFGLTLLWYAAFFWHVPSDNKWVPHFNLNLRKALTYVLPLAILSYGAMLEYLQGRFTDFRASDVKDIIANGCGILIATVLMMGYAYKTKSLTY